MILFFQRGRDDCQISAGFGGRNYSEKNYSTPDASRNFLEHLRCFNVEQKGPILFNNLALVRKYHRKLEI